MGAVDPLNGSDALNEDSEEEPDSMVVFLHASLFLDVAVLSLLENVQPVKLKLLLPSDKEPLTK